MTGIDWDRYNAWRDTWDESYAWLTSALTAEFGTDFSVINSGGGCMLIVATLENRDEVMIGDYIESLSSMEQRRSGEYDTGYGVGIYPAEKYTDENGVWLGRNKSHPFPQTMSAANRDEWHPMYYPCPADDDGDWVGAWENNECVGWADDAKAETAEEVIALVRTAIADRLAKTSEVAK